MSAAALDRSPPLATAGASTLGARIEIACAGWRGPALAALIVCISALPGLLALPPLDRDESRFAQAAAQMLETEDYVNIRFQGEARDKKPVGIYWLQAAAVRLLSSAETRDIRPYRLPSLLGAMLAAAACAWGAAAAFGARGGAVAGAVLGASLLLSSEAFVGKTDAVLCGAATLAMAGLGRLYLASRGEAAAGTGMIERLAFWSGMALAVLDKGPVAPLVAGLAVLSLAAADRRWRWITGLGWSWGLLLLLLVLGPWAFSVTVSTDGGFWTGMHGDIAPKLTGARESHGGPPGLHAVLAPILIFPSGFLLPAAAAAGWSRRSEPAVRFALAWLVPAWLLLEIIPTKLAHYPLPLYGALAWLMAATLVGRPIGARARAIGVALGAAAGAAVASLAVAAAWRYGSGSPSTLAAGGAAAALALAASAVGGWLLWRQRPARALAAAGVLGVFAHMLLAGVLAPRLTALWVSDRAATLIDAAGLDPRDGRTVGPVAVSGYAEPSLVFALGTDTELDANATEAAEAVSAGSPAFVEARQEAAFRTALTRRGAVARAAGVVSGFDYSDGRSVKLTLWRPIRLPPLPADLPTDAPAAAAVAAAKETPP